MSMKDWLRANTWSYVVVILWACLGVTVLGAALELLGNYAIVDSRIAWGVTVVVVVVAIGLPLYMRWVRPKLPPATMAKVPSLPRVWVACGAAVCAAWLFAVMQGDAESTCSEVLRGHHRFATNTVLASERICLEGADLELIGSVVLEFRSRDLAVLAPSRIYGTGSAAVGRGAGGKDAAGGEPLHCREAAPERDLTGAPSWCTSSKEDWEAGAKDCNTGDLARTCDVGEKGGNGPTGGYGPIVQIVSERLPDLTNLTVTLEGGTGGAGGAGGRGTNLYWILGGCDAPLNNVRPVSPANTTTQATHTCPPGAPGAPGDAGVPGECRAMRSGGAGQAISCAALGAVVTGGQARRQSQ